MNKFELKYFKYKNKYLNLKNQVGNSYSINNYNIKQEIEKIVPTLSELDIQEIYNSIKKNIFSFAISKTEISQDNINKYIDDEITKFLNLKYSINNNRIKQSIKTYVDLSDSEQLQIYNSVKKIIFSLVISNKNLSYENEYNIIINETKKYFLKTNPKIMDNNIYCMLGHGCSTNKEYRIPEGCQYVTYGLCGDVTYKNDSKFFLFKELFDRYPDIFDNPKDNIFQLKRLFGDSIHVHFYGVDNGDSNTYINSIYDPFSIYFFDSNFKQTSVSDRYEYLTVEHSGLIESGSGHRINDRYKNAKYPYKTISMNIIKKLFSKSIYPTVSNIQTLKFTDINNVRIGESFIIDQKTLFDCLPGVYYNMLCRQTCNSKNNSENSSEKVSVRRQKSNTSDYNLKTLLNFPGQEIKNINDRDFNGNTLLHKACIKNNLDAVFKIFSSFTPELNFKNSDGYTPLHIACNNNNIKIVELLTSRNGIKLERIDNECMTPLYIAFKKGYIEIIRILIAKGANINAQDIKDRTILMYALKNKNIELIQLLLDNNADLNCKDKDGKTALMYALNNYNNIEQVTLLLEKNADVNCKDEDGKTALMYALNNSTNIELVKLLLDNNADVNCKDKDGQTALMYALFTNIYRKEFEIFDHNSDNIVQLVTVLLDKGATTTINDTDEAGETALMYAQKTENKELVNLLLKHNALQD